MMLHSKGRIGFRYPAASIRYSSFPRTQESRAAPLERLPLFKPGAGSGPPLLRGLILGSALRTFSGSTNEAGRIRSYDRITRQTRLPAGRYGLRHSTLA